MANESKRASCIADGCGKRFDVRGPEGNPFPFAHKYCPACVTRPEQIRVSEPIVEILVQSKHTPGPWVVYELANDGDAYGNIAGMPIVTTEDLDTEICGACFNPADARLIAAAPDMKDELVELCFKSDTAITYLEFVSRGTTDSFVKGSLDGFILALKDRVKRSRVAIAKAEGKQ